MQRVLALLLTTPALLAQAFLLPSLPQVSHVPPVQHTIHPPNPPTLPDTLKTHTTSRARKAFLSMALPSEKTKTEKPAAFYPFETAQYAKLKKDDREVGSDTARQLLGMKGAAETDDLLKIRIQLMKPVTWIPLIWGVVCGAAASGNYHWANPFDQANPDAVPLSLGLEDAAKAVTCMLLAGPLLTGFTQTINDWYDKDIDAINEPYRPIPSGRISEVSKANKGGSLPPPPPPSFQPPSPPLPTNPPIVYSTSFEPPFLPPPTHPPTYLPTYLPHRDK